MKQCGTCRHWLIRDEEDRENRVIFPYHPVTYEQPEDEAEAAKLYGHRARVCHSPKVLFYQRPAIDGAAVMDGSEYRASLITGEQFGCVLHEPTP